MVTPRMNGLYKLSLISYGFFQHEFIRQKETIEHTGVL